jgi:hypothetical protein
MEDAHYNACKEPGTQCNHTFVWDNFGFDGPILTRDFGFDIPDQNGANGGSLGWKVPTGQKLVLTVAGVHGTANATGALVEFTWWALTQGSWAIAVNGHPAHNVAWPYGAESTFKSETLAVPVPVSELVEGSNTVSFSSSDSGQGGVSIANIDIILVGAAGPPANTPTPGSSPTATAQPTNTAVPTSTPTSVPTDTPAPTSSPTPSPTDTPAPTSTPTPSPTDTPAPTSTPTPSPTDTPAPTSTPTPESTCAVAVVVNGQLQSVTRPPEFCTDQ